MQLTESETDLLIDVLAEWLDVYDDALYRDRVHIANVHAVVELRRKIAHWKSADLELK